MKTTTNMTTMEANVVKGRARRESGSGVKPHAAQGRMPREAVFGARPNMV